MESAIQDSKIERFFSGAWLAAFVNMLGVAAGYLGSHFDRETAAAWSALRANSFGLDAVSSGVWAFAGVSLGFGALFAGTAWAQQRRTDRFADQMGLSSQRIESHTVDLRRSNERLETISNAIGERTEQLTGKADSIEREVQRLFTLPPKGFLITFAASAKETMRSIFATRLEYSLTKDVALAAIRGQLLGAMRLAASFDQQAGNVTYGCNVMLFKSAEGLCAFEREMLQARLRFVDRGVDIRQLAGVLTTIRDLSVSRNCDHPDESLPLICLPIPVLASRDIRTIETHGVLPGAPSAFVRRVNAVVETPDEWRDKLASVAFSEHVRSDVHRYLEDVHPAIQSFLSIPLFPPKSLKFDDLEHDVAPFGVLNIHSSAPSSLLAEKLELLSPLLSLSVEAISREVWRYINANEDERNDYQSEAAHPSQGTRTNA